MKEKIRLGWIGLGTTLLNTPVILATTQDRLTTDESSIEGWMILCAGIGVCIAGILLYFLNKLFAGDSFKKEKVKKEKVKKEHMKKEKPQREKVKKVPTQKTRTAEKTLETHKSKNGYTLTLVEVGATSQVITVTLKDQVILGRNKEQCHVAITDDLAISNTHCKLYIFNEEVYVMDLNSTNGTYVNGKQIQYAVVLKSGDYLEVGARVYCVKW